MARMLWVSSWSVVILSSCHPVILSSGYPVILSANHSKPFAISARMSIIRRSC